MGCATKIGLFPEPYPADGPNSWQSVKAKACEGVRQCLRCVFGTNFKLQFPEPSKRLDLRNMAENGQTTCCPRLCRGRLGQIKSTYLKVAEQLLAMRPGKLPPAIPASAEVVQQSSNSCPVVAEQLHREPRSWPKLPRFRHIRVKFGHLFAELDQTWPLWVKVWPQLVSFGLIGLIWAHICAAFGA